MSFLPSFVETAFIVVMGEIALQLAKKRTVNLIELVGLWVIIFFGILQTPTYFPKPFNFEVIGVVTISFILGYYFWMYGFTHESIPPRSRLLDLASAFADWLFGLGAFSVGAVSLDVLKVYLSTLVVYGINSSPVPTFGLGTIGAVINVSLLSAFSASLMAGGVVFLVDAVGHLTGQFRLRRKRGAFALSTKKPPEPGGDAKSSYVPTPRGFDGGKLRL